HRGALEAVGAEHGDGLGRVLVGAGGVVGDVGNRVDGDVDGGRLGDSRRAGHRVGEAVRPVVVGRRRVGDGVVGVDDHRAVRRTALCRAHRGALEAVGAEHGDGLGRVLVGAGGVVGDVGNRVD